MFKDSVLEGFIQRLSPLERILQKPFLLYAPKESRPGFLWQGFALRRPPFRSCEKEAKARLGAKIRVRPRLPKGGSLAHRIFPLRTPIFTGAQNKKSHCLFPALG